MILTSLTVSMLLWMDFRNRYLWACLFITVGFGLIGFLDDYDKVTKRSHKGVSGRMRLFAEFVVAAIGCSIITWGAGTELYIPFYNGPVVDLGPFYIVFARLRRGRVRQCGEPHRRPRRARHHAGDHRQPGLPRHLLSRRQRRLRRLSRHSLRARRRAT